ncbi:Regulator of rDNA transcription protein 15 [Capsicum baccatum]|uniref:Regulator of rDNA transcription protein 15 n=1 Tax=Capsicum baccatum TaxID=33114 RepID=A0A2G2UYU6_CAPBA|nr:Regulator of rDNA transcription protein 15 [Capsicum baccatum]
MSMQGAMAPRCLGSMAPWFLGALVPWRHGALVPRCHGATVRYGATVAWRHSALAPWRHGAMEPWCHGATVPWCHSTTVPSCLGATGKTNLSHDGLNPAHVPYWWVNNPTLGEFCFTMIGRADIEGSKSNVAMNVWLPQASYPCGNFSETSSFEFRRSKESLGHAFAVHILTGNQNQKSFYPSVLHEISVLVEIILGHLRYLLTDVPPQPNSPPDIVFRPERALGQKRGEVPRFRFTEKVK